MISSVHLLFLNIGTSELILIVFVALMLFGGEKLPELARGLGRGIRDFKDASDSIKKDINDQINTFEKDLDVRGQAQSKSDATRDSQQEEQAPEPKLDQQVELRSTPVETKVRNGASFAPNYDYTDPEQTDTQDPSKDQTSGSNA